MNVGRVTNVVAAMIAEAVTNVARARSAEAVRPLAVETVGACPTRKSSETVVATKEAIADARSDKEVTSPGIAMSGAGVTIAGNATITVEKARRNSRAAPGGQGAMRREISRH
jgi:hypothetical protein